MWKSLHVTAEQARLICVDQKHSCATETLPPCTKSFFGTKPNPNGGHHSLLGYSSYQVGGESRDCCPPPRQVPACFLIWKQQREVARGHTCRVITEKCCGIMEIVQRKEKRTVDEMNANFGFIYKRQHKKYFQPRPLSCEL